MPRRAVCRGGRRIGKTAGVAGSSAGAARGGLPHSLNPVPKIMGNNCGMLAGLSAVLMPDQVKVHGVGKDLVDMPPRQWVSGLDGAADGGGGVYVTRDTNTARGAMGSGEREWIAPKVLAMAEYLAFGCIGCGHVCNESELLVDRAAISLATVSRRLSSDGSILSWQRSIACCELISAGWTKHSGQISLSARSDF